MPFGEKPMTAEQRRKRRLRAEALLRARQGETPASVRRRKEAIFGTRLGKK